MNTEKKSEIFDLNYDQIKGVIESVVDKSTKKLSQEEREKQKKMLLDMFWNKKTMPEILNIDKDKLLQYYQYATSLFRSGKYNEALSVFLFLTEIDPTQRDYFLGIAMCHHRLKEYVQSYTYYMFCAELDIKDPLCFFYAYDCLLNIEDLEGARFMLQRTIERCIGQPKYEQLQEKALLSLKAMYSKLEVKK